MTYSCFFVFSLCSHRGFETVTYIFPGSTGSFEHEDFVGHRGTIGPGDLQWMTAGRGILHSEMPHTSMKSGDVANGLQLWVNLPAKEKMCEPRYQELPAKDVPRVKQGGIEAHIISGTALGTTSPVYTRNPVDYFHFFLQPHTTLRQPIAKGHNSFLYTIDGPISVGEEGDAKSKEWIQPFHTVTLTNDGKEDGVTIRSGAAAANFVLLAGKPIGEPIVQHGQQHSALDICVRHTLFFFFFSDCMNSYMCVCFVCLSLSSIGPFVMTSQREIQEAIRDYQNGQNGFERAPGWRSEIGKPITDHL